MGTSEKEAPHRLTKSVDFGDSLRSYSAIVHQRMVWVYLCDMYPNYSLSRSEKLEHSLLIIIFLFLNSPSDIPR